MNTRTTADFARFATPGRRTQAERSGNTRATAIAAAIAIIFESGYARATFANIAARAGLSPGALQHQFPSKANLMAEVVRTATENRLLYYKSKFVPGLTPLETASDIIDAAYEFAKSEEFAAVLEIQLACRSDPDLDSETSPVFLESENAFTSWFMQIGFAHFPEQGVNESRMISNIMLAGIAVLRAGNSNAAELEATYLTWKPLFLSLLQGRSTQEAAYEAKESPSSI